MVIAENSIDGMSYVQHAGIKGNVLVVSTCGNPSAQALDLLARKASEFKSAKFEIARDADKGGEAWTGAIKAAIHLGAPDAKVAVRAPEDRYKDWNNQIRGLSRTDEVSRNKARLAEAPSAPPSSSDDKRQKGKVAADRAAGSEALTAYVGSYPARREERGRSSGVRQRSLPHCPLVTVRIWQCHAEP